MCATVRCGGCGPSFQTVPVSPFSARRHPPLRECRTVGQIAPEPPGRVAPRRDRVHAPDCCPVVRTVTRVPHGGRLAVQLTKPHRKQCGPSCLLGASARTPRLHDPALGPPLGVSVGFADHAAEQRRMPRTLTPHHESGARETVRKTPCGHWPCGHIGPPRSARKTLTARHSKLSHLTVPRGAQGVSRSCHWEPSSRTLPRLPSCCGAARPSLCVLATMLPTLGRHHPQC